MWAGAWPSMMMIRRPSGPEAGDSSVKESLNFAGSLHCHGFLVKGEPADGDSSTAILVFLKGQGMFLSSSLGSLRLNLGSDEARLSMTFRYCWQSASQTLPPWLPWLD